MQDATNIETMSATLLEQFAVHRHASHTSSPVPPRRPYRPHLIFELWASAGTSRNDLTKNKYGHPVMKGVWCRTRSSRNNWPMNLGPVHDHTADIVLIARPHRHRYCTIRLGFHVLKRWNDSKNHSKFTAPLSREIIDLDNLGYLCLGDISIDIVGEIMSVWSCMFDVAHCTRSTVPYKTTILVAQKNGVPAITHDSTNAKAVVHTMRFMACCNSILYRAAVLLA